MKTLPNTSDFNKFNYNAGNLSSVSGYLPLFNYVQSTGLLQDLESIPFDDNRKNPLYSNYDIMLSKLTFNLTGLWGSTSRHQLGNDPLLENILIPSQSTDSKFQSRITEESVEALSTVLTNQACTWVVSHQTEVVLDQDSTVIETYGQQEYSAFIPHYQVAGFHPLLLTESHSQLILAAQNRPGNSHASMGSWEQLNPVIQKLRSENPDLRIRYRADSAAYDSFFFSQLENADITYYIRAKHTKKLKDSVQNELESQGFVLEEHTAKNPFIGEIQYSINKTQPRRVVFKAYQVVDESGQMSLFPAVYCVVTNDLESSAEYIMDFYEKRGSSENINKEVKDDFFAGNLSHKTMLGNSFDLLLCCLSYNIFHFFQQDVLEGKDKSMRMNTYRIYLGSIAAKVTRHCRQRFLSFASNFWNLDKFSYYLEKTHRLLLTT